MKIHTLQVTTGLARGMTVQFAEGFLDGEIGTGVLLTDEAFDFVEPFVAAVCANWTSYHRYGVYELSLCERKVLATLLGDAAKTHSQPMLLRELAEWLEAHCGEHQPLSILGY